MIRYTFSGHESFQCKSIWLKKGYDFVNKGFSFNEDNSIVELGVGKNMVSSIRYWMRAFGLVDKEMKLTKIAHYIFDDKKGKDPFLEDVFTVWVLHYFLIKTKYSTIYDEFFMSFQRGILEFNKIMLFEHMRRQFMLNRFGNASYNENTIKKDIDVLLKNYVRPRKKSKSDDSFTLLSKLNLISLIGEGRYQLNTPDKDLLPILLYLAILDNRGLNDIIDFEEVKNMSRAFCLSEGVIIETLNKISSMGIGLIYQNSAGERLISLSKKQSFYSLLDKHYKA